MKVLHIGEYVKGGVSTYVNELIKYQTNNSNIEEVFLTMSEHNSEKEIPLVQEKVLLYKYERSPKFFIKAAKQIFNYIDQVNPDIVHIHSTFAGFFVRLPLFFRRKKFKVVYCSHGWAFLMDTSQTKQKIYSLIERVLSIKTDLIINISQYEHDKSLEYKLPENKSVVIHNGISLNEETKTIQGNIELDSTKINLLFVGRFDRQKGLDILLEFFHKYSSFNINLYVIGAQVLSDQKTVTYSDNVKMLGWVNNKEIDEYYKLADAIIIPSRWEGFGLVATEAMKNKKPVISSNRGALPEIVKDGETGFIFDLDNLSSLHNILQNISKPQLEKMGNKAYQRFRERFTSQTMNEKIVVEYKELLN
ncbi:glycosyltransferase [Priestia sp. LL-8]|uniref:glycosyltransferase n=1 Tax=Priestia sp. LL-8 TaxID=3110068 RepID=UPI002E260DB6|nr:glycosyltransferase [Priestia sp. LL-8]